MTVVSGPGGGDVLSALKSGRIQDGDARLRAATRLLESSFYEELFKAMRETVPEGGALSGGSGEEMFTSMMDQNIATSAAMKSDSGLGSALYKYFTRGQVQTEGPAVDTSDGTPVDPAPPTEVDHG